MSELSSMGTNSHQQCFYCRGWFPAPVYLHHDNEECQRTEAENGGDAEQVYLLNHAVMNLTSERSELMRQNTAYREQAKLSTDNINSVAAKLAQAEKEKDAAIKQAEWMAEQSRFREDILAKAQKDRDKAVKALREIAYTPGGASQKIACAVLAELEKGEGK